MKHVLLLLASAKSAHSLASTIAVVQDQLQIQEPHDVAYTLAHRSRFDDHLAFTVADASADDAGALPTFVRDKADPKMKLGFIFTGQGAQWPSMGRDLLALPAFLSSIRATNAAMAALPDPPSFTVEGTMQADLSASEMDEPRVAQLMSIALEVALVDRTWRTSTSSSGRTGCLT